MATMQRTDSEKHRDREWGLNTEQIIALLGFVPPPPKTPAPAYLVRQYEQRRMSSGDVRKQQNQAPSEPAADERAPKISPQKPAPFMPPPPPRIPAHNNSVSNLPPPPPPPPPSLSEGKTTPVLDSPILPPLPPHVDSLGAAAPKGTDEIVQPRKTTQQQLSTSPPSKQSTEKTSPELSQNTNASIAESPNRIPPSPLFPMSSSRPNLPQMPILPSVPTAPISQIEKPVSVPAPSPRLKTPPSLPSKEDLNIPANISDTSLSGTPTPTRSSNLNIDIQRPRFGNDGIRSMSARASMSHIQLPDFNAISGSSSSSSSSSRPPPLPVLPKIVSEDPIIRTGGRTAMDQEKMLRRRSQGEILSGGFSTLAAQLQRLSLGATGEVKKGVLFAMKDGNNGLLGGNHWKESYVVLYKNQIEFWRSEKLMKEGKGLESSMSVGVDLILRDEPHSKIKYAKKHCNDKACIFSLTQAGKTLYLLPPSLPAKVEWMEALDSCINIWRVKATTFHRDARLSINREEF